MKHNTETRKRIEKLIYDTFDALDPSGLNSARFRENYAELSDTQFFKQMTEFINDDSENFILDIDEYKRNVTMERCEAAAEVLGIPLVENVFMKHLTMNKSETVVSKMRCFVGYINIKRTQQLLHKKNGLALESENNQHLTGQVTGDDKDARDSDIEATMLVSLGANQILQELHGPRADDVIMRREMLQSIAAKGYVRLEELDNLLINKTTLNTVAAYLTGMQIKSDLITDSYDLPKIFADILDQR